MSINFQKSQAAGMAAIAGKLGTGCIGHEALGFKFSMSCELLKA